MTVKREQRSVLTIAAVLAAGVTLFAASAPLRAQAPAPAPVAQTPVLSPAPAAGQGPVTPTAQPLPVTTSVSPTPVSTVTTPAGSPAAVPATAKPVATTATTTPASPVSATMPAPVAAATAVSTPAGADVTNLGQGTLQATYAFKNKLRPDEAQPMAMSSLFFTKWQYALLQEAKRGFLARPPTSSEVSNANGGDGKPVSRGIRELSLSGIAYKSAHNWTIWFNGQRLTSDALPPQILDLKVTGNYIDIKWFDNFSNLIYPVRLRPHQRFNLDQRIFLPGVGSPAVAAPATAPPANSPPGAAK